MQWGLIGLFFGSLTSAYAQERDSDDADSALPLLVPSTEANRDADEEITVYGKREVDRRRRILDAELKAVDTDKASAKATR